MKKLNFELLETVEAPTCAEFWGGVAAGVAIGAGVGAAIVVVT